MAAEPLCFTKYAHNLSAHSGRGRTMQDEVANAKKSPVNLRIRTSLQKKAKDLGLNLSQTLENPLEAEIRRREQLEWLEANRQAIEAYNRRIDDRGPALAGYRGF